MKKNTYIKKAIRIFFITTMIALSIQAQQSVQYSQFLLNDYGLNPAVAGASKGLNFLVGKRTQWRGFDFAPQTSFINATKDFGKKGYRNYWHGVGAYFEEDKAGFFATRYMSASYAMHIKISAKYFLSFGIAVGAKNIGFSSGLYDANDPALDHQSQKVWIPTITPGLYLYSKKLCISFAVRNLYKSKLEQGSSNIGSNSKLQPAAFLTLHRKFRSPNYSYVFVPAIHIQSNFSNIVPSIQYNFMAYYVGRVGLGLTYRMHDAICAILQIRVYKNIIVGFSYDYTISKFRYAKANSDEMMIGFSPVMGNDMSEKPGGASDCPRFEL